MSFSLYLTYIMFANQLPIEVFLVGRILLVQWYCMATLYTPAICCSNPVCFFYFIFYINVNLIQEKYACEARVF